MAECVEQLDSRLAQDGETGVRWGAWLFWAALILLAGGRLWLTADAEIVASRTPHDALWYLRAAERAYWGNVPYDQMIAFRPPAYPLWLWANWKMGIPQRLAIEGAYVASLLLLVYALMRAGMSRGWALLTFVVMAACPTAFRVFRWTMADAFNVPLATALAASALTMLCTRRWVIWGVVTGVMAGLCALNRSEGYVLSLVVLGAASALAVVGPLATGRGVRASLASGCRMVAIPVAVLMAMDHTVKAANLYCYGIYAADELRAPGHKAVMKALTRIAPSGRIDYVTISHEALETAYQVSPTFGELKPYMDATYQRAWHESSKRSVPGDEIGSGYVHWALRDAAAAAGHFTSGGEADRFFARAAKEINKAIDGGKVRGRLAFSSYLDPDWGAWLPRLPGSVKAVWNGAVKSIQMKPGADTDASDIEAETAQLYDRIACRRADPPGSHLTPQSGRTRQDEVAPTVRQSVRAWLSKVYGTVAQSVLWTAMAAGVLLVVVLRWKRLDRFWAACVLLLAAAALSRLGLYTLIDACSWHGDQQRYLFPAVPTLLACAMLVISGAVCQLRPGGAADVRSAG